MSSFIAPDQVIMIIGAMKSGTTSLFDYLATHPEILACNPKEPEYFSANQSHKLTIDRFEDLFKDFDRQYSYVMEASTGYTKFPNEQGVPSRIKEYGLNPKFIYVVRNPFDRIESHFNYMNIKDDWDEAINSDHLLAISNYHMQLEEFMQVFSKDQFLVLDFDELNTDTKRVMGKLQSFLSLNSPITIEQKKHSNKTQSLGPMGKKIKSVLGVAIHYIPGPLRKGFKNLLPEKTPPKVKLSDTQRESVQKKLQEGMIAFGKEWNFNVSKWGF